MFTDINQGGKQQINGLGTLIKIRGNIMRKKVRINLVKNWIQIWIKIWL